MGKISETLRSNLQSIPQTDVEDSESLIKNCEPQQR